MDTLKERYEREAASLKGSLAVLKVQREEATSQIRQLNLEIQAKTEKMEAWEKVLSTREEILNKHEEDLRTRELRYQSNKSIYNI
jgi:hypothetical protein